MVAFRASFIRSGAAKEKPPPVSRWRFAFIRNPTDERIAQGGIYKKE